MKDRHLDQVIMCAIYLMCKVSFGFFFINRVISLDHALNYMEARETTASVALDLVSF